MEEQKQSYKLKEKLNCKLKIYIESYVRDYNFTNYLELYKKDEIRTLYNYTQQINNCLLEVQNKKRNLKDITFELVSIFINCENEELEYILEFLDFIL